MALDKPYDLVTLMEKFDENPNLAGAIRNVTRLTPLESSEVGITIAESKLLEEFPQTERPELYLEYSGLKNSRNVKWKSFEDYLRDTIAKRKVAEKLRTMRREIEVEAEDERTRF